MTEIRFLVPSRTGSRQDDATRSRVEASARGTAPQGQTLSLSATVDRDVVKVEIVNGPELILHPKTARDLFNAQSGSGTPTRRGQNEAPADPTADVVMVPTRLEWRGSQQVAQARGNAAAGTGQVVVHAFEVLKDVVSSKGANLAAGVLAQAVDGLVSPGLHRLTEALPKLDGPPTPVSGNEPLLVLVHGTFSSTAGSFAPLWRERPDLVKSLLKTFNGRVFGFEHETLTRGPLDNAVQLAKLLPAGADVHFLTHSRGGLVAEAIAQLASRALSANDAKPFENAKYGKQGDQLAELGALVHQRLRIKRITRVACPARGTLLASGRLDAYLSVLKWGLQLAKLPVVPEIVDFLGEVAKRRTEPDELPGLEAMMPESAFMKWLHQAHDQIAGELRVVAGDTQGDSVVSWLKTLLSDAFFWTDNDLIVQTRSMYGGSPRAGGSIFFLDRGGKVGHFSYFSNPSSAEAIVRAVESDEPAGFRPIGLQSSQGLSSSGSRGKPPAVARTISQIVEESASPTRPAVILLPGILGSHLLVDGVRVWLGPRILNGLELLSYDSRSPIKPDCPIGVYYDALTEHLASSHEVILCPFDWRKPVEAEAANLAEKLTTALDARKTSGQPVRILAHSMGGLVARSLEVAAPEVWDRFIRQDGARLVMLGTPQEGAWAPMQVLSGDNAVGNVITCFGALFDEAKARRLFAKLPGFIQLQAGMLDPASNLVEPASWKELARQDQLVWRANLLWHHLEIQKSASDWGIPDKDVLAGARDLYLRLRAQDLSALRERVVLVVGRANSTPSGYEVGDMGLDYLQSDRGDGTVTLESALLTGVRTYQVDVHHAKLPTPAELFDGYVDLLKSGSTNRRQFVPLTTSRGGSTARQGQLLEKMPRTARFRGWTDDAIDAVEGTLTQPAEGGRDSRDGATPALRISVVNGDLTFVSDPLLIGHYRSVALSGAEGVMDLFLGGIMSEALHLRRYPTKTEESEVFNNLQGDKRNPLATIPRPAAVIVVGLGPEGELRAEHLSKSVRQGVIGYAQRLAENPTSVNSFELSTTLVGSGGLGVSVATSARAVAQGVRAANERLLREGWPIVSKLSFIELYEDRATEALRELVTTAERAPTAFEVEHRLQTGQGPLPRPETQSYRGAEYDLVSALDGPKDAGQSTIAFTIDTRRARSEVRSSTTQLALLRDLIREAELDRRSDSKLGKSLARVLIPVELDSFFGNSEAVMLEVDEMTAAIPWEILSVIDDDDQQDDKPWAIRSKLVRKLKTKTFRENPNPAGKQAEMLVIGDPECDRRFYPELPGARREAGLVAAALGTGQLIQASARSLVAALLERPYSVVHIAGHGKEDGSGVVMAGDQVLGAGLIERMRRVPDLVFVNCCYSAHTVVGEATGEAPNYPKRAATIAEGLIRIGVRCVVATGWAVDDDAAERFARVFYTRLLAGDRFIEATSAAREEIWREFRSSNTWAAYQCYGDPDWVMTPSRDDERADKARTAALREPLIASASALLITLKNLASQGASQLDRLVRLERAHEQAFGKQGHVAEAFAAAFAALGETDKAIEWYRRGVDAPKGEASFRSLEQWSNLSIRRAAEQVDAAYAQWQRDGDTGPFDAAVTAANGQIDKAVDQIERLHALLPTYERANLLASAWKRRAIIAQLVGLQRQSSTRSAELKDAIEKMRNGYQQAESLAESEKRSDAYYATLNRMNAELILRGDDPAFREDSASAERLKKHLDALNQKNPEFWTVVQDAELLIYRSLCAKRLEHDLGTIVEALDKLHQRVADPLKWASVRDQQRFALRNYLTSASPAETAAATKLIQKFEAYAAKQTEP